MSDVIWMEERPHPSWSQQFSGALLHDLRTPLHHLAVLDNDRFGRMLFRDGILQVSSADGFIGAEMQAHLPLVALGEKAKRVLIIGGGDGAVLSEVLRHAGIERAVLCETDHAILDVAANAFPETAGRALADERVEVAIGSAAQYVADTQHWFDAILIVAALSEAATLALMTPGFLADCKRCLNPGGVMLVRCGPPFLQPATLQHAAAAQKALFADVSAALVALPSVAGGPLALLWASDDAGLRQLKADDLQRRANADVLVTKAYSPAVHQAAFAVPAYVQSLL